MRRLAVITGGGTGGHVFPMMAIAEQLRAQGWAASEIRYVGSRRGQDRLILRDEESELTTLPGRGIRRSLRPSDLLTNVGAVGGLAVALVKALVEMGRWRPTVVVSVGGYASFAVDAAAVLWRRPLVLVDLDAVPGAVHRLFARWAAVRCVALGSEAPGTVVTGTPIREKYLRLARDADSRRAARTALEPPIDVGRVVVVVMTGSLGSLRVNEAVCDLARRWRSRHDVTILHVTGRRDFDRISKAAPALDGLDYRLIDFADMAELWAVADVAVCRAGALTVSELTILGIPAVLVPLPGAPDDHQSKNARRVADAGAAVVVSDAQCNGARLEEVLEPLLSRATLDEMSERARLLGRRDAASSIARVVAEVGR